ncbi:class F sortase [Nocardioides sp. GY 10113]|uniref:class F sortase n=1 Tax=Nocardioides sp. GY 10113 TaxID=2569761 RepID=UPI0014591118|nr:class F sortase [Nocardioides sp. GY 10113]
MERRLRVAVVVVVVAAIVGLVAVSWLLLGSGDEAADPAPVPPETATEVAAAPEAAPGASPLRPQRLLDECRSAARGGFVPSSLTIPGIVEDDVVRPVPRDEYGVLGVPPLTSAAKQEFAWDADGAQPGSRRGLVGLTTHTWSDGSAMGNRLLDSYRVGDLMVLEDADGRMACYRTAERIVVTPEDPDAVARVYATGGPPQVVVIVCSGIRLGAENWTHRTVWFADLVR